MKKKQLAQTCSRCHNAHFYPVGADLQSAPLRPFLFLHLVKLIYYKRNNTNLSSNDQKNYLNNGGLSLCVLGLQVRAVGITRCDRATTQICNTCQSLTLSADRRDIYDSGVLNKKRIQAFSLFIYDRI